MKLADVLDTIKNQNGLKNNAELARLLEIDLRRIGEYYKGREPMDDDYPKIAMACGRRVDELQAIVKLAGSKDEKSVEVWRKYYKSIGGLAASFMLTVFACVTFFVTPDANASANQYLKSGSSDTLQIMRLTELGSEGDSKLRGVYFPTLFRLSRLDLSTKFSIPWIS